LPFIVGCNPLTDLSAYSSGASVPPAPDGALPGSGGNGGAPLDAGNSAGSGDGARPTVIDQPEPLPTSPPAADASPPEPENPAVTVARFVRLVADADVNMSPYSSAAELGVLDERGTPIAATGWIATADSAEAEFMEGAAPAFAIDGDPGTMWHTPWSDPAARPPHPHFLQIDLGAPRSLGGFSYLPRQDASDDGSVTDYRFFVSADGVEWGEPLAEGRFDASKTEHEVLLAP
jgi:F5/8 type C domain-containing protein